MDAITFFCWGLCSRYRSEAVSGVMILMQAVGLDSSLIGQKPTVIAAIRYFKYITRNVL